MARDTYKEALEEAVYTLHKAETEIFTAMVNVGFNGVYEEIGKLHEPGEVINLELAMFENTTDTNLDLMVKTINKIFSVKNSLINLNALEVDLEDDEEEEEEES